MIRTRWAAIGAAVAVTLGAGGIGLVSATSPSDAVAFVPIEPCRLVDTRAGEFNVGDRATPLGADETFTAQATGDNGECTGIPTSATGLGLNVTAVSPSAATVLTIWGSGDKPNASSLNPTPGQPPTPNAVTTGLTGAGEINIWNAFGTVEVIVDIVGYYTDHNHDDRYYTEAEVDTALSGYYTKSESDARYDDVDAAGTFDTSTAVPDNGTDTIVSSVTVEDAGIGRTVVNASFSTFGFADSGQIKCEITTGTTIAVDGLGIPTNGFRQNVRTNEWDAVSATKIFSRSLAVIGGDVTYNLVCDSDLVALFDNIQMTAVNVPDDVPLIFLPLDE